MPLPALLRRLRESVSATELPALQRGTDPTRESVSQAERDKAVKNDDAFPDGSFPITTQDEADKAWDLRGHDENHSEGSIVSHIRAQVAKHGLKMPGQTRESVSLRIRIREATLTQTSPGVYEATILQEGPGNPEDNNYYTAQALREAVASGRFEGLQAYINHPSQSEEVERPERDVRYLAGHFREARFIDGHPAEVRAKFVPGGMDPDAVKRLIESAINSVPGKPLVGISIDGYGYTPDSQDINGRTYHMVREFAHLGSADIVTRTATGGRFHRRLQEAWRNTPPSQHGRETSGGQQMKPAELQDKVKAALTKLSEASALDEKDAAKADGLVKDAISALRECESATIEPEVKIQEKIVEKPVAATEAEKDQLAVKLREAETRIAQTERERDEAKRDAAEKATKLQENESDRLAAKVLREAEVPGKTAASWFAAVAACADEAAMKRLVEARKAEREEILAEVRESYGLVEGAGERVPLTRTQEATSGDLLDVLGLDRDEYVPAA